MPTNHSAGGGGGTDNDDGKASGGDDDGDAPTGTDRPAHHRLTSADLRHLGAVAGDSAHALVKEKRGAQLQKEQEKATRKQSKQQVATARLGTAVVVQEAQ